MAFKRTKERMEYFVACVTEFADAFGLDYQKSFDYLDRYSGLDFLIQETDDAVFISHEQCVAKIDIEGGASCLKSHSGIW